ncbi:MAG: deoxyribodipyrimidine photo-lyase [Anaerolineae bacterium]|nr:deoxyribodipyrimidine photo-lyase [Anaerolineae bacterium]
MTTAICWIRRDLRLSDSAPLSAALSRADRVVPAYVLDPVLLDRYAETARVAFLLGGLRALDAALRTRGSQLIVRRGDPAEQLAQLVAEAGASAVYAEEDHTPYARRRDSAVAARVPLHLVGSPALRPPGIVLKADGDPYTVYTPFRNKWKSLPPPRPSALHPAPAQIPTPAEIASTPLPDGPVLARSVPFPPGEAEALRRLAAFTEGDQAPIYAYQEQRDRMDMDATSRLSPYLRFGMLSARQAIVAAYDAIARAPGPAARRGAETWLDELIWREFYIAIQAHYPNVYEESFRPNLRAIPWDNDPTLFEAWRAGQTGYPVVDAGMRQLLATGWMHNRARMIVASFLVKDVLIDWRRGERAFMQLLVDGDPAANNGGWQWTAGTGTDAAPYFRIFNPVTQGRKYDPSGDYVRRWVPELAHVPVRHVHAPWEMARDAQRRVGCVIGRDYPAPVVDHAWARERTLAAYRAARADAEPGQP